MLSDNDIGDAPTSSSFEIDTSPPDAIANGGDSSRSGAVRSNAIDPRRRYSRSQSAGPLEHSIGNLSVHNMTSNNNLFREYLEINNVDVAAHHGGSVAPIRGRESHTADLTVFDRYMCVMKTEREYFEDEMKMKHPPRDGNGNIDADEKKDGSIVSDTNIDPFNSSFWSYVRSILSNAKAIGFNELDDPTATVPMGPRDTDAFAQKMRSIGLINPITPKALGLGGGFTESDVLTELVYATRAGVVRMQWAPECSRCGSSVTSADRLGDLPTDATCAGCHFPNDIDSMDNIKVLFDFNPDILYILADNAACTPSAKSMQKTIMFASVPATSTGSGFRYSVGVGGDEELRSALEPGRYRMHCPVAKTDNFLVVQRQADEEEAPCCLKIKVSDVVCDESCFRPIHGRKPDVEKMAAEHRSRLKTLTVPHGKIHFDVLPDTKSFFALWVQDDAADDDLLLLPEEERPGYTTATSVIHNRVFSQLFANQLVSSSPDTLLSIQNIVLVFTDVVGSTDMYATMGDGPALRLIRKHFGVLFGSFTKRGRVVKTIGDAVMASFTTGRAAMEAVADALRLLPLECRLPDGTPLQIRVGIHCGPVVVVPLNGVNDFFGQTVNIAARVEAAAKACECFVTDDVLRSDPDTRSAYYEIISPAYVRRGSLTSSSRSGMQMFDATPETELHLKGVKEVVRARGFRLHSRPRRSSDILGRGGRGGDDSIPRTYRRSATFERLDVSRLSIGSDDDSSTDISLGSLTASRHSSADRASLLGDFREEGDCDETNGGV